MLNFPTLLLRAYYASIGWNEDNLYSNITRSSTSLLDFPIPRSLSLQLANSPTPVFYTSYALDALPQLNGSISYITCSEPLQGVLPSRFVPFKSMVDRFQVHPAPRRPVAKDEVWLGGRRVDGRDFLLYSRLHFPSLHLSGLATTRLTPTLQAHLAFLHQPAPPTPIRPPHSPPASSSAPAQSSAPPSHSPPGNVLVSLQHDTGQWSGEYTFSAQDEMFGVRGMYNFGYQEVADRLADELASRGEGKRIDEEEAMEGGLRGRFSAGGEVYFSRKQRSFGISTGLRFTTVPPLSTPTTHAVSPPTTLTLLYNPLMGFLSSAYSAQVSPTVAVSTRFGVNVYSYESDLTIGGEWWIGRGRGKRGLEAPVVAVAKEPTEIEPNASAVTLRPLSDIPMEKTAQVTALPEPSRPAGDRDGVLKARVAGDWSVALLYESRIRNCLVSVGLISDLISRSRPIRSVGLEVQFFSG